MHKNENIKVIEKELGTRLLVLKGGVWTLFGFGSNQVLRLLSNLLLTHLLAPDIFGLMALVSIFITGLQMFSDLGIGQCIIQNPRGDEPQFLNTAFSMQIIRGVFLWLASCALAYPFSLIYNQSGLFYLIPIASLSTVIAGFANTAIWSLTRHVQLGKVIILNTLSNFVGVGVSIIWALVHPTVWVIVGGNLAMVTCECIGSHFLLQSRNWPQWDLNARKSILGFGKGIFLSSATWFLAGQAERLILGRFVSLAWLGVFSIALLLAESVSNAFQEVISRAIFPTIAKSLRENRVQALRQHEKMRWAVLLTTITLAILIIAAAKPIVGLVFNAKYQEASWMIQILILRTVIGMIWYPNAMLLMADARLKYFPVGNIARFVMISVGTIAAFRFYNSYVAVWVLGLASIPSYAAVSWGIHNHFKEIFRKEMLVAFIALLAICCYALLYHR